MSKQEVINVMGYPGNRQFSGVDEAWQYCERLWGPGYNRYFIIWFHNGIVSGLTTKNFPGAENTFFPVNWEEKPDKTIEIRSR